MKKLSFLQLSVLALLVVWCSLQVVTCEKLSDHEDQSKEHTDHEEKSKEQDDDVIEVRRAPIKDSTKLVEQDFVHGFIASISIIIISELGDKTFFIAAIMAMRHSRMTVFLGAVLALAVMTVLSALFGWVTTVIPRVYTFYISTALFAFFGLKMLKEGVSMSWDEGSEELEEVQSDLKKKEDEFEQNGPVPVDAESGTLGVNPRIRNRVLSVVSRVFLQAFTMTFLAEWGDRSQLATIILAAREDVAGVTIGAVIGHALCTGLAVLGGRMIAQRISVKTVTLIGGVVFLIFAAASLIIGPDS